MKGFKKQKISRKTLGWPKSKAFITKSGNTYIHIYIYIINLEYLWFLTGKKQILKVIRAYIDYTVVNLIGMTLTIGQYQHWPNFVNIIGTFWLPNDYINQSVVDNVNFYNETFLFFI